ncbi:MAG: pectin esterase [Clostridia bacterium]|nr:pectin esterase [Clostridia bacterium]
MKKLYLTPEDDLQHILDNISGPTTIYLKSGVYRQKVEIAKNDVILIGENRETCVITYDDYAKKIDKNGVEYTTFRTYTLCVSGERVRLENLTVENSNTAPEKVGQCVALSVNCRNFSAENVDLRSTQDTLFMMPFPDDLVIRYRDFLPERQLYMQGTSLHLFKNCRIYGTVDFIFGGAEAYFKGCEIVSVHDNRNMGFVAAPCHSLTQRCGFYFIDCTLRSENVEDNTIYLARPWRDFGKSTFINCRLGKHIKRELFDKWNDTNRDQTARFEYFGLDCEFTPSPVKWARELTSAEANEIINECNKHFK